MPKYVDGFVLVVPKDKVEEYKQMAQQGKESWLRHGALEYYECRGNDLAVKEMGGYKTRSFTDLAQANEDEEVWFSFIVFESKEHRDAVNAKVDQEMGEMAEQYKDFVMPFDMNKMASGGFSVEVEG